MKVFALALCATVLLGSSLVQASSDDPVIVRGRQGDIVEYPSGTGGSLEAWEIVLDWAHGVYLNYSRAPWGDRRIGGKDIFVCHIKAPTLKLVGISEDSERVLRALELVLVDRTGSKQSIETKCWTATWVFQKSQANLDLRKYVDSL